MTSPFPILDIDMWLLAWLRLKKSTSKTAMTYLDIGAHPKIRLMSVLSAFV